VTRLNLPPLTFDDYERAALDYLRSLPLEHFMEAMPQGIQREITLESLALLRMRRSDVQVFNEMLVQYPIQGGIGQVVPDNMVVIVKEPTRAEGSYNLPFEPAGPFFVLEYVSTTRPRKDYEDSFHKYETELRVPYCLLFYPHRQDLRVYRHGGRRYKLLKPNAAGRFAIPELDLEIGLLNRWVRFWYSGRLLELPAQLQEQLDVAKKELSAAQQQLESVKHQADQERQRARREKRRADKEKERRATAEAELERLRAVVEQLQREQHTRKPETE
jgi:Uma2 family endonuclease